MHKEYDGTKILHEAGATSTSASERFTTGRPASAPMKIRWISTQTWRKPAQVPDNGPSRQVYTLVTLSDLAN
ncbi:MAG: hypothetical protein L6R42_003058, partial [Xanthoria sp. 1 TBL-2021]